MSATIVHYECRNPDHLRGGSRRGNGGLVIHHGSVGYCDGLHVDGAHRWVATGGVPIQFLFEASPTLDGPGTYRTNGPALLHVRPSPQGTLTIHVDNEPGNARADLHVGAKLSDDPDWPDGAPVRITLFSLD
jgi:hypothetical protein